MEFPHPTVAQLMPLAQKILQQEIHDAHLEEATISNLLAQNSGTANALSYRAFFSLMEKIVARANVPAA